MSGVETRASRSLRTPQQEMPSEDVDQYDGLFQVSRTHGNGRGGRFQLLLKCTNDSVDRITEQASGFLTTGHEIE